MASVGVLPHGRRRRLSGPEPPFGSPHSRTLRPNQTPHPLSDWAFVQTRSVSRDPKPVGPPGILVFRGSTFALRDFSISVREDGGITSNMRPMVAWEIWPLWVRVAIDHELQARTARSKLLTLGEDDQSGQRALRLADETRAGMVTITSAAFAIEAMALSAADKAGMAPGIGANASAARRIAEVLKQCFDLHPQGFPAWRRALIDIFRLRNLAVHADAGLKDPMPHPALNAGVPLPAHAYRLENASAAVEVAITTAEAAGERPKRRLGKKFVEATSSWREDAQGLRDLRGRP